MVFYLRKKKKKAHKSNFKKTIKKGSNQNLREKNAVLSHYSSSLLKPKAKRLPTICHCGAMSPNLALASSMWDVGLSWSAAIAWSAVASFGIFNSLFHHVSVCLWWIWMVLHRVQLPHSFSHIFLPFLFLNFNFFHFFFTLFYLMVEIESCFFQFSISTIHCYCVLHLISIRLW